MIAPGPKHPGANIKHCVAVVMSGLQPSKAEQNAALSEGVELLFDFLADVKRIASAGERLAICVATDPSDPDSPATFGVHGI